MATTTTSIGAHGWIEALRRLAITIHHLAERHYDQLSVDPMGKEAPKTEGVTELMVGKIHNDTPWKRVTYYAKKRNNMETNTLVVFYVNKEDMKMVCHVYDHLIYEIVVEQVTKFSNDNDVDMELVIEFDPIHLDNNFVVNSTL